MKDKYYLQCRCAWCGADLGKTEASNPAMDGKVSHGICRACVEKMQREFRARYEEELARDLWRLSNELDRLKKKA